MRVLPRLRIALIFLTLCFCMEVQASFFAPLNGLFVLESSLGDFDPSDFEEDLLTAALAAVAGGLWTAKSNLNELYCWAARVEPLSPPPKSLII